MGALKIPLEAEVLANLFGISNAGAGILWALYKAKGPLHEERLALQVGVTATAVKTHTCAVNKTLHRWQITGREHCYSLSVSGKETVRTALAFASDRMGAASRR